MRKGFLVFFQPRNRSGTFFSDNRPEGVGSDEAALYVSGATTMDEATRYPTKKQAQQAIDACAERWREPKELFFVMKFA